MATAQPPATNAAPEPTERPDGYPALPTATSSAQGYPAPTQQVPPTGYPADMAVWILRPYGAQCEDSSTYLYQDVKAAAQALEEQGVSVLDMEAVGLMVCEACGCPTSEHFRLQINAQDLAAAEALGWSRE
jgi:hypothetical protein